MMISWWLSGKCEFVFLDLYNWNCLCLDDCRILSPICQCFMARTGSVVSLDHKRDRQKGLEQNGDQISRTSKNMVRSNSKRGLILALKRPWCFSPWLGLDLKPGWCAVCNIDMLHVRHGERAPAKGLDTSPNMEGSLPCFTCAHITSHKPCKDRSVMLRWNTGVLSKISLKNIIHPGESHGWIRSHSESVILRPMSGVQRACEKGL